MRRPLSLLLLAGLLPVVALGGTFAALSLRDERRAMAREAQLDAHFTGALLGVKLEAGLQAVEMIAQSPAFDDGIDTERFRVLAQRLVANRLEWRALSLARPDGIRLIDVPRPIGRPNGPVVDPGSLRRVVETGRPAIGDILKGPRGGQAFAIRAPIVRGGEVVYVASAIVRADELKALLEFRSLPRGWRISLIDGAGNELTVPEVDTGRHGVATEASAPVPGTTWSVRVDAPTRSFAAPTENAALVIVAAAIASILLVVALARILAAEMRQSRDRDRQQLQGQRMEALGHLTGGVAHDFNNLLTPILAGFDLIAHKTEDEKLRRFANAGLMSANRAKSLVERLLAFSRQQSLRPVAVDVGSLFEGMTELIKGSLTAAVDLSIEVKPGLCPVLADKAQLELAILNLVINARDAMPDGGTLTITAKEASAAERAGLKRTAYVTLTVADTGEGMSEEVLRRAIDPFYTTKPVGKGTGLGLSMVHGFAAQSDGALRLTSAPQAGTCASIVLPCGFETSTEQATLGDGASLAKWRVLLVDDDEAVRSAALAMLEDAGQTVVTASSVQEAIDILKGQSFDAVVTDYVMPGMNGGDLIAWLRSARQDVPVLLMTGYADFAEGVTADVPRLMKPFGAADLRKAMVGLRPIGRNANRSADIGETTGPSSIGR